MKREDAILLAVTWQARLMPYCERVEIAGSVRRKKPEVHDIEIVAKPLIAETVDLFGSRVVELDMLEQVIDARRNAGDFTLKKNGPRMKQLELPEGITIDLFIVRPPAQWGVIFALRTGPAEFNHWLVTQKRYGGAMPGWMKMTDGALYRVAGDEKTLIQTPEEEDFFRAIGVEMVRPEERKARWNH